MPRIEVIAQPIAEEVETQQDGRQQPGRYQERPGSVFHLPHPGINERAERGLRLLHAEAEKAQERLDEDRLRDSQGYVYDDDADQVWRNMAKALVIWYSIVFIDTSRCSAISRLLNPSCLLIKKIFLHFGGRF